MKDIKEKYLPLGTVVILKGATKRLMITGFCAIDQGSDDYKHKTWDYSGCLYPEGYINSSQICLFDHDQIEKIYHLGLTNDEEEKEFKENLKAFMAIYEKAVNEANSASSKKKESKAKVSTTKKKTPSKTKTATKSKTTAKKTATKSKTTAKKTTAKGKTTSKKTKK